MTVDNDRESVLRRLIAFVGTELIPDRGIAVEPATPLVASGLLKSLETARLLAFLHSEFGVRVPPTEMSRRNFENLERVTDLVVSLRAAASRSPLG
ncbi:MULTISPECIES: acyl carrier protein [unclassified Streptomyces]|uniref:acyl carrier protein n=1 Tax=unclassified Streptomyces TaxID=2593676 RepID=UPI000DC55FD6|nr:MULTISPECIES: acyl carrier protein [Streptomyces]MYU03008.1 acyl carrier protein [Streptomyces sp. SID8366]MYU62103.1 acyl carrier protein [Streptomyces sp. SID69]RAJ51209.1 acyl carrier protein [Streptomyces sp. PsTaAH-130]TXJ74865.1 acyl carrier protein [Streptomyces lavendulae]